MSGFFEHFNFVIVIILMMTGLFVIFASHNMIKKLVGLSIFQTSVFLLYISASKVLGGQPPILPKYMLKPEKYANGKDVPDIVFSNPLPHVLILTAIVVGVATLAIGLALVVRIREEYGTIEDDEADRLDYQYDFEGGED